MNNITRHIFRCAAVGVVLTGCRALPKAGCCAIGESLEPGTVPISTLSKCMDIPAGEWGRIPLTSPGDVYLKQPTSTDDGVFLLQAVTANGWNGCYCLYSVSDAFVTRLYYRIGDNQEIVPLAENENWSWRSQDGEVHWMPEYKDLFLDIDGDGVDELICPYICGGDGVSGLVIFRLTETGSEMCHTYKLLFSIFPDFKKENQILITACDVHPKENLPWSGDPLFVGWYQVPDPHAKEGEYPVKDVRREFRLKGKKLAYRPYVYHGGWNEDD